MYLCVSARPSPKLSPIDSDYSLYQSNGQTSKVKIVESSEHVGGQRLRQEQENLHHKNENPASQQKNENTVKDRMNMKEPSQEMTLDVKPVESIGNEFPQFKKIVEDDIHYMKQDISSMQTNISQLNDETKLRSGEVATNTTGVQLTQDVYTNRGKTELSGQKIEKVSKDITKEFAKMNDEISQVKSAFSELIKDTRKQTDSLSKQMQILLERVGDIATSCQILKESTAENKTKTHKRLAKIELDLSCVSGTTVDVNACSRSIGKISEEKIESLSGDVKNLNDRVECISNEIRDIEQIIKEEHTKVNEKHKTELEKAIREVRRVASANSRTLNILNKQRNKQSSSAQKRSCDLRDFVLGCVFGISILIAVCVASGVCLTSIASMTLWPSNFPASVESNNEITINKPHELGFNMEQLKQDFPSETERFWSSMFAPIHRVVQEGDPARPAVILIATKRSTRTVAECLARKVATVIEALYDLVPGKSDPYLTLEAQEMKALTPSEARSEMANVLSSNFEQGHMTAVIHDLGTLPPEAAALLHAYCDHESAHFRKAVLLLTAYLEPAVALTVAEVEAYLLNAWDELGKDVLKPLLSRVGNNIAIMSTERNLDHCNIWRYFGSLYDVKLFSGQS